MILLLLDIRWNYLTFLVEVSTTWPHPHNASEILLTVGRYLTFISITYEKTLAMSIYFWDKFLAFSTDLRIYALFAFNQYFIIRTFYLRLA
jgi:hypothetical protein